MIVPKNNVPRVQLGQYVGPSPAQLRKAKILAQQNQVRFALFEFLDPLVKVIQRHQVTDELIQEIVDEFKASLGDAVAKIAINATKRIKAGSA